MMYKYIFLNPVDTYVISNIQCTENNSHFSDWLTRSEYAEVGAQVCILVTHTTLLWYLPQSQPCTLHVYKKIHYIKCSTNCNPSDVVNPK